MKSNIYLILLLFWLGACKDEKQAFKATGVFEADEVFVSAQSSGEIVKFGTRAGETVQSGQLLGVIDSSQLVLSKRVLEANREVIRAKMPNVSVQIEATQQEITKQEKERDRIIKLMEGDVATQKQLDDINAYIGVLQAKLASQKSSLGNSARALVAQQEVLSAQVAQINQQIDRCRITAPISGTVLLTYVHQGEIAGPGKPLLKVADLHEMTLKAYVTAGQLSALTIGQSVQVFAELDAANSEALKGTVSWISSKAEFTPKTVQTQDERANLVYAVKVLVPNDGVLKIGMYGHFTLAK